MLSIFSAPGTKAMSDSGERERFISMICIYTVWFCSKFAIFYSEILIDFSDFNGIFADFTLVYCEICGFQLNPWYLCICNLNPQYCELNVSDCVSPLLRC